MSLPLRRRPLAAPALPRAARRRAWRLALFAASAAGLAACHSRRHRPCPPTLPLGRRRTGFWRKGGGQLFGKVSEKVVAACHRRGAAKASPSAVKPSARRVLGL